VTNYKGGGGKGKLLRFDKSNFNINKKRTAEADLFEELKANKW